MIIAQANAIFCSRLKKCPISSMHLIAGVLHIVHLVSRVVVFNCAEAAETVSEEVALERSERGDQNVEAEVILASTHQMRVVDVPRQVSKSLVKKP